MTIAAIVLAGGSGSRFSGEHHKLVTNFRGRPLAAWAFDAVVKASAQGTFSNVYVISGAVSLRPALRWLDEESDPAERDGIRGGTPSDDPLSNDQLSNDTLADIALGAKVGLTVVENPRWAEGQATSLTIGVARAGHDGHDAVVVGLADQPLVDHLAWVAVAKSAGPIAVASFDGLRRPPVKLDAAVWPLLPQSGDEGARSLLRLRPDLISEVPCSGNPSDIDTTEDLRRWS